MTLIRRSHLFYRGVIALLGLAIAGCEKSIDHAVIDQNTPVSYSLQVKPILSDRCFACHGADGKNRKAGLQLHTAEQAYKPLEDGGFAIVPGDAQASLVYQRIVSTDPDFVMPPAKSHVSVSALEAEMIKVWIDQGANYEKHWAYILPKMPAVPTVSNQDWAANTLDLFTLKKMQEQGLNPSQKATKDTLIRRAFLDVTGLIPTPAQLAAYLADNSSQAYQQMLDDLFASSRYGEKMASYWLELARYGDTHGYQDDGQRTMWPWRDWVIQAFNQNMPFDQFMIEQLAGDLLKNPSESMLIATGFNRNTPLNGEQGIIPEEFRVEYIADKIDVTSTTFLGHTMACARCHDHKYDPLSQKDYYKMFAFFNNTIEKGIVKGLASEPMLNYYVDQGYKSLGEDLEQKIKVLHSQVESIEENHKLNVEHWAEQLRESLNGELLQGISNKKGRYFGFDKRIDEPHDAQHLVNTAIVPGKFGNAIRFGGGGPYSGSVVSKWVRPKVKDKQPLAISAWTRKPNKTEVEALERLPIYADVEAKAPDDLPSQGFMIASMLEKDTYRGFDLTLNQQNNIEFTLIDKWPESAIHIVSENIADDHEWHHIYAKYYGSADASGVAIFLNGQPLKTTTLRNNLAGSTDITDAHLHFGTQPFVKSGVYGARELDEVRILDKTLNRESISLLARVSPSIFIKTKKGNKKHDHIFQADFLNENQRYIALKSKLLLAKEYLARLKKHHAVPIMVMSEAGSDKKPFRSTYLLERGSYDKPDTSEELNANIPSYLGDLVTGRYPQNRLGLAQWLASEGNPLTARVMVNRLWQMVFGRGIVNTSENFGNQGELPSHPELLDWLALEFVQSGWDIQHMLKLMMLSNTYQQSSDMPVGDSQPDPENIYLSRGGRYRLSAEAIRDSALLASGLLVDKLGGPSVQPYQPEKLWESISAKGKYVQSEGDGLYRRSLYSYWKRTVGVPSMTIFDASTKDYCVSRRETTNTPLQALVMLNDPQFVEASRVLAEHAYEAFPSPEDRIDYMAKSLISRSLESNEMTELTALLTQLSEHYQSSKAEAKRLLSVGDSPALTGNNNPAELAPYAVISSAIMNLSEFVTRQ